MSKIVNAQIDETFFGREEHGILTCYLYLKGNGFGVGLGGRALDGYDKSKKKRVAMDWDFEQGKIYNVAQIFKNIQRGISELEQNSEMYVQYEPENKWGTTRSALEALKSLRDCIVEQDIDKKYLYVRW